MRGDWRTWLHATENKLKQNTVSLSDHERLIIGFEFFANALVQLVKHAKIPEGSRHWCPICLHHDPDAQECYGDCELNLSLAFLESFGPTKSIGQVAEELGIEF